MDSTIITSDNSNGTMNNLESFKKTGLGERLKTAREAMQLTQKEVAARLHLGSQMIALIEHECFEQAPPRTFIRGYIRSYARLVNFSEPEITVILQELEAALPSDQAVVPPIQSTRYRGDTRNLRWLTYLILLTLGVLVSMWWHSHSRYIIANAPSNVPPIAEPVAAAVTPSVTQSVTQQEKATGSDDQDDQDNE